MYGCDLYKARTQHSLLIVSGFVSWGKVALTFYKIVLPKVVEHLTFNLPNIQTALWTDRRPNSLQMNLCEKPRLVHTCRNCSSWFCCCFWRAIIPISQLGRIKPAFITNVLVRTFLQCWRIFLTSSAQKTFNSLPSPPQAHTAHARCQLKFTFQALWETRESESTRRRKSQVFVGLQS